MSHYLKPLCATALLATLALQAQAAGRLAELSIIDRNNATALAVYVHAGQNWVAGTPGAKYAMSLCNRTGGRLLAVASVDGINVLSGASAAWHQTGYVFAPGSCYEITGWRKSDSEVAAFEFSTLGDSYAAATGRPKDVGVIGVALFRERERPVIAPSVSQKRQEADESRDRLASQSLPPPAPAAAPTAMPAPAAPAATPAPAPEAAPNRAGAAKSMAERGRSADTTLSTAASPPMQMPKLGTAHGQREESVISHTEFERARSRPDEIIQIRYDSREALISMGIIARPSHRTPQAFPQSGRDSYVPDPPPTYRP